MNRISSLFGIQYPIIQGGMVWCSGWKLASAVSNAGGLGLIGSGSMYPDVLREHIRKCRAATDKPFGVNIPLMYPQIEEIMNIVVEEGVKIVFTSAGNPKTWTGWLKERGITDPNEIMTLLQEVVTEMVSGDNELHLDTQPSVILVIGVNGVGKTTTIGKLASRLKKEGKSVILGAADTFRAAAIEQLEVWAERADVPIIKHAEGADPAAVVYDTISAAKARHADVVICDTAGRLPTQTNLMEELARVRRSQGKAMEGAPHEVLLVVDGTNGQNALAQVKAFDQYAGLTGLIVTKLDGTAKGGVLVAITAERETPLPIYFVGVGETIDDLQPFDAKRFASALVGEELEDN